MPRTEARGGKNGGNDDRYEDRSTSLYRTPGNEINQTPEAWAKHYEGRNWNSIAKERGMESFLKGLVKVPKGPFLKWRYVKLKDGKILDMRHVLVVGMEMGTKLGTVLEYAQYVSSKTRPSANQIQDYYSNEIGSQFLKYMQDNSIYYNTRHSNQKGGNSMERNVSWMFYNFLETKGHVK